MLEDGQIIPLFEDVRRKIYYSYQDMKKQNSFLQIATNKTDTKYRLMEFKKRFLNFFPEISAHKVRFKNPKEYAYVEDLFFNPSKITKTDALKITYISMKFLKYLGVTDIAYKRNRQSSIPMS